MSKEKKLPVSLEFGAKAEFKAEIKGEIPSSSVGRLVDALTDIIRPFTEGRGFKADLVRLQREDVLIKIAQKAQRRLQLEGKIPSAIPNRVLIPLLERASWTNPDDSTLMDAWATLMASTSSNPNPNSGIFTDVLGKLDSEHVKFLAWMSQNGTEGFYQDVSLELSEDEVRRHFVDIGKEYSSKKIRVGDHSLPDILIEKILKTFRFKGNCLTGGAISFSEEFGISNYYEFGSGLTDSGGGQSIADALVSLNLVSDVFLTSISLFEGCDAWVHYYRFTAFGGDFVQSCTSGPS